VARVLDEDELVGNWTLVGDELDQLSGRRGATKLGFALLLRFYAVHGRFPTGRAVLPDQAVVYVARLVDVPVSELGLYEWDGRTIKDHRKDIRKYLTVESCREVARIIASATFAVRQTTLWGEGTTAVASDSTHFLAFDQNIFTEWHSRYRRAKRGVLIYWTVEVGGAWPCTAS
jgi:hypothetical protein